MAEVETHRAVEAVFRIERAKVLAALVRLVRDIDLAEELTQDALVAALTDWPTSGLPRNPAAWLLTAARRRALDRFRRASMVARSHLEIGRTMDGEAQGRIAEIEAALDDGIGDERLTLLFVACHPLLKPEQRTALTLRMVGGLTTGEIARAFLANEATIAQRIVRAKKALSESGAAYELPDRDERSKRLSGVMEVVYLIFNEGYAPTVGADAVRPDLAFEAQRLGRILAAMLPDQSEVLALSALMELQASRFRARSDENGAIVPLARQDRNRWDRLLIRRGLAALDRARALAPRSEPYVLQAMIAACHARAPRFEATDWRAIADHYDALAVVLPSPVVELNRAVAHSMAFGPQAGLARLHALPDGEALSGYGPLHAARGDFLQRIGDMEAARAAFERAAALSGNARERDFLVARAAACLAGAEHR